MVFRSIICSINMSSGHHGHFGDSNTFCVVVEVKKCLCVVVLLLFIYG